MVSLRLFWIPDAAQIRPAGDRFFKELYLALVLDGNHDTLNSVRRHGGQGGIFAREK
jgi:hypothetical protein